MFWVGPTCSPTPTGRWIPVAFSAQAKMIFSTPPHRHTEAPVLQLLKESGMLWLKQVAHTLEPLRTPSCWGQASSPPPRGKAWDTLFLHLFFASSQYSGSLLYCPVPCTVVHCYTDQNPVPSTVVHCYTVQFPVPSTVVHCYTVQFPVPSTVVHCYTDQNLLRWNLGQ